MSGCYNFSEMINILPQRWRRGIDRDKEMQSFQERGVMLQVASNFSICWIEKTHHSSFNVPLFFGLFMLHSKFSGTFKFDW